MNVLHAFPFFSIQHGGGSCDLLYKLVKAQYKAGLKPTVYCGDYKFEGSLATSAQGVPFVVNRSWLSSSGFSLMFGLNQALQKNIGSIDIVHMHAFRTFQNIVLYRFCRKYDIPYVIDAHGAVPYAKNKRWLKKLYDLFIGRKMLRDASFVIAETEVGVAEYLECEPLIQRKKITILSPPFDVDEFRTAPIFGNFRRSIGVADSVPIISFLGRLHYIKGNDFLIRGFKELLKKEPSAILVFLGGDDGHEKELRGLVQSLGLSRNVIFFGFISGQKKNEALVDSSVVAQMSREEAGAWAPFEAVLCGTPIVVTAHTGAGSDVKKINAGETVELDDVEGLGEKLFQMLKNYELMKARTLQAKSYIEDNLSFDGRIHEYTDLYRSSVEGYNKKVNSV